MSVEYIDAEAIKETDKAVLCKLETGDEVWVPKSLIGDDSEVNERGDEGTLAIPTWFAKQEAIV